jgi:hypothetical protein
MNEIQNANNNKQNMIVIDAIELCVDVVIEFLVKKIKRLQIDQIVIIFLPRVNFVVQNHDHVFGSRENVFDGFVLDRVVFVVLSRD